MRLAYPLLFFFFPSARPPAVLFSRSCVCASLNARYSNRIRDAQLLGPFTMGRRPPCFAGLEEREHTWSASHRPAGCLGVRRPSYDSGWRCRAQEGFRCVLKVLLPDPAEKASLRATRGIRSP
ncbi:hypothetical protein B0H15DRAFT_443551 [Mycena belliarum]|uniref:Uncharacterized protein n=1 Tax=Mycena belliarum TaxID=1033014 RepID=A0AAD6XR78_9AGAR|nr:hypothetical protein B0H15DRAFT_443551 [Mycena belliae]